MEKFIPLVNREVCLKIWVSQILYIEQRGRKVYIYTEDNEYGFYGKLENLVEYLDSGFFHCKKFTIINFDKVDKMQDQTIYFQNGEIYNDIGRSNFIKTKQIFASYLKQYL